MLSENKRKRKDQLKEFIDCSPSLKTDLILMFITINNSQLGAGAGTAGTFEFALNFAYPGSLSSIPMISLALPGVLSE